MILRTIKENHRKVPMGLPFENLTPVEKSLKNDALRVWVMKQRLASQLLYWPVSHSSVRPFSVSSKPAGALPGRERAWDGTEQPLMLPGSCSARLFSGSHLRFYERSTALLRATYLQGEGFFEESKNLTKHLYTTNLTTKALGTHFQVQFSDQETARYVKVKAGNVSVKPVDSSDQSALLVTKELEFDSNTLPIHYHGQQLCYYTFGGQLNGLTTESSFKVIYHQVYKQIRGCD